MKSLNVWIAVGASLGMACGSDAAPVNEPAMHGAGHAGVSAPSGGTSAGAATPGGTSGGAGTSGQSGAVNGGATQGGTAGLARGGVGASSGGGAGASAAGSSVAGAALGGAGSGGVAGAGSSGMDAAAGSPTTGGRSGAGGAPLGGGAGAATAGSSGASGAGGAESSFTCSQLTGGQLVEEWFIAGFEKVVDDPRWQVKWRVDGYLEEWANPQSSFWSAPVDSPCASGTSSPDRIVFPVVSWAKRAESEWVKGIEQALTTFRTKYPGVRRIDLMTQVRGPNNMLCPTAPTQGETIVVPPELDAAIDDVAKAHPGFVFVGPRVEARSCSDIQGGGPHLTSAGNTAAAVPIASYFATAQ